jgi:flagellar hook-associated protein 1 FlgK
LADLFNVGTTALTALQQAITTTGHNISNVNTEGYSRQRANFATLPTQFLGGSYVGSGTTIAGIERAYDDFLTGELHTRTSSFAHFDTLQSLSGRLDNLLADPSVGLSSTLNSFFGAVQDVANNPGSIAERQVLMGQAQTLADRFNYIGERFQALDNEVNARISTTVGEINGLTRGIADINSQIVSATARGDGAQPNDLLDSRDELVRQLSEKVGVNTVIQSDGSLNVMMGDGQPLVVGGVSMALDATPSREDLTRLVVTRESAAGSQDDLSRFVSGGELGALLSFRSSGLDAARNQLGVIAVGVTDSFNSQNGLGLDLNGQIGGNLFTPIDPVATPSSVNAGTGAIAVAFGDVSDLTGDNYRVSYDGAQYSVMNLSTQAVVTGSGPFSIDGLTISLSGAPAAGDTFLVEPTKQSAAFFSLATNDPNAFAAASPVRAPLQLGNGGNAEVSGLGVSSTAGLPLGGPVTLSFNPDALGPGVPGYDVTGIAGGPLAYDPVTESGGKTFTLGDLSFSVSGVPVDGDALVIENNTNGSGDNRNALAMADLQTGATLYGGLSTYQEAYGAMVADMALVSQRAQTGASSESVLLDQATAARDSLSGVNLDEEAADLIRYQQAYQAAAQIISVADELFQALLNATAR